ncbi:MAG: hypothetical protein AAGG80_06385, partial [Pseudomonadota bacterium]
SIAIEGQVKAHVTYEPMYRIPGSASMYFKAINHDKVANFVKNFVKKFNFTGQISFDIIDNNDNIYLIECNPRASSGLHLLYQSNLANAFQKKIFQLIVNEKPSMLSYAMYLSALPRSLKLSALKKWRKNFLQAREIIYDKTDKSFFIYQFFTLFELMLYMLVKRSGFRHISTYGINYDG